MATKACKFASVRRSLNLEHLSGNKSLACINADILSYQGLRFAILSKGRYDETFAGEDAMLTVALTGAADMFVNWRVRHGRTSKEL